jgi:hypothetical protein
MILFLSFELASVLRILHVANDPHKSVELLQPNCPEAGFLERTMQEYRVCVTDEAVQS